MGPQFKREKSQGLGGSWLLRLVVGTRSLLPAPVHSVSPAGTLSGEAAGLEGVGEMKRLNAGEGGPFINTAVIQTESSLVPLFETKPLLSKGKKI